MKTKILAVLGILIAAGIGPGRLSGGAKETSKYRTAVLARGDIMAVTSSTGVLNPEILVDVGSELSGQIIKVNADFNAHVRKGEIIAELDRTPFDEAVKQDEAGVGRIKEGEKVEFTVESFPRDTFTGRVVQVQLDAEVDSDVVRYPVVCEVDNAGNKLRPGMTATVTIHTEEAHGVLKVPNAAMDFVPAVLTTVRIKTGLAGPRETEVIGGDV